MLLRAYPGTRNGQPGTWYDERVEGTHPYTVRHFVSDQARQAVDTRNVSSDRPWELYAHTTEGPAP